MIKRYMKKPVVIEAIQLIPRNTQEVIKFLIESGHKNITTRLSDDKPGVIEIPTEEGTMDAKVGSYIIKGVEGEVYPCKPEIFAKTYEEVAELQPPTRPGSRRVVVSGRDEQGNETYYDVEVLKHCNCPVCPITLHWDPIAHLPERELAEKIASRKD